MYYLKKDVLSRTDTFNSLYSNVNLLSEKIHFIWNCPEQYNKGWLKVYWAELHCLLDVKLTKLLGNYLTVGNSSVKRSKTKQNSVATNIRFEENIYL